eukprot:jgi/Tetstr1/458537/TSEL_044940.t1
MPSIPSATVIEVACAIAEAAVLYWLAGILHEAFHLATAVLTGRGAVMLTAKNAFDAVFCRRLSTTSGVSGWREAACRHAGWIGSLGAAALIWAVARWSAASQAVMWLVAAEAVYSDLLRPECDGWLHCGCFGLILLSKEHREAAYELLQQMVRVTQMRGSQSGGLIAFRTGLFGSEGIRTRVVNGKRGDLSVKLVARFRRDMAWSNDKIAVKSPAVYAGHTRFATSSKATLAGTHPHRWSPRVRHAVWCEEATGMTMSCKNVEVYVCHNGDLDYYEAHGLTYPLSEVRSFVEHATGVPCSTPVDSVVIAGLMELLRTKGVWQLSLRYALAFATPGRTLDTQMPTTEDMALLSDCFTEALHTVLFGRDRRPVSWVGSAGGRAAIETEACKRLRGANLLPLRLPTYDEENAALPTLVHATVAAFFDNDLMNSVREFLRCARGSFGLSVVSSLDTQREIVLAAKGQTMSVAFYPRSKTVLYGSEQAAVKAALGLVPAGPVPNEGLDAVRLDLNDLEGEVCQLSWMEAGSGGMQMPNKAASGPNATMLMGGALCVRLANLQREKPSAELRPRLVRLEDNPLITPIPPAVKDPVGADVAEIPSALAALQRDWVSPGSLNRLSACSLGRDVLKKLADTNPKNNGRVDVLLTGCEVSLWLGEQFAADLHRVLPKLAIRAISSNKASTPLCSVLGLLGHSFPIPQTGFQLAEEALDLTDAIVIIVSHSGGTFAPLAISKLLQAVTLNIYVVTSEWDTQVARELRSLASWSARSRIFSTGIGLRPAEPCSISVAATHQLLTQILLQLMQIVQASPALTEQAHCIPDDTRQLEALNQENIASLEAIVGTFQSPTERNLRNLGRRWAFHVLEAPISWMLTAAYILATVTAGTPLVSGVARAVMGPAALSAATWSHALLALDALLYLFFPQLAHWAIRLAQRRPLMHRMAHRSVLIGDVPWVAQAAEAFLSKLFASAYSNASVSVYSANAGDHLVHRHTHRVVRGSLLAVGRPDGRLSALASSENAVMLAVSQAASIQSLGHACCEAITVGHNPIALPLSKGAIFLPFNRPMYLCETGLVESGPSITPGISSRGDDAATSSAQSPTDAEALLSLNTRSTASSAAMAGRMESMRKEGLREEPSMLISGRRLTASNPRSPDLQKPPAPGTRLTSSNPRSSVPAKEHRPIVTFDPKSDAESSPLKAAASPVSTSLRAARAAALPRRQSIGGGQRYNARRRGSLEVQPRQASATQRRSIERETFTNLSLRRQPELAPHGLVGDSTGGPTIREISLELSLGPLDAMSGRRSGPMPLSLAGLKTQFDQMRDKLQHDPTLHTVEAQVQALLGQVEPSTEAVFGEGMVAEFPGVPLARLVKEQQLSCELMESRFASMQRLVSFFVMFHEMGRTVADFWPVVSFGLLGYGIERSHSVMRIATTASPVCAMEVDERIRELRTAKTALRARDAFMGLLRRRRTHGSTSAAAPAVALPEPEPLVAGTPELRSARSHRLSIDAHED